MRTIGVATALACLAGLLLLAAPATADVHFEGEETVQGGNPAGDIPPEIKEVELHQLVTVKIRDFTNFRSRLQSDTESTTEIGIDLEEFFNVNSRRGDDARRTPEMGIEAERSTEGTSNERKRVELEATITAEVIEIRPDGDTYVVEARRVKEVDDLKTTMVLSGVIRREDIGADNVVDSDRIANLDLNIQNEGSAARPTRAGWLRKFFDFIWPF